MSVPAPRAPIPAAAWWLGAVSFVNDSASEMVLPLLPSLLAGTVGAPAEVLGAIEGTATAVASILKLVGGRLADRTGRHGALVIGGYSVSNILRPLMALASSPGAILALRIGDRVGKGLRTAPRDALLAAATPPESRAAAYSIHRGLDHAGTIVGALIAAYGVRALGLTASGVFGWSAIPGVLVIVLSVFAVRATERSLRAPLPAGTKAAPFIPAPSEPLPRRYFGLLAIMSLARLGLASELFLLLFAGRFVPLWGVPGLWALLHLVKSATSFVAAPLGSRLGARAMVVLGWSAHAAVFAGFALTAVRWNAVFAASAAADVGSAATRSAAAGPAAIAAIVGLFLAWGLYAGLSEGAEKSLVAARAPATSHGTAFGVFHMVTGLVALPASLTFGFLWEQIAPAAAFGFGAVCAALAVGLLVLLG